MTATMVTLKTAIIIFFLREKHGLRVKGSSCWYWMLPASSSWDVAMMLGTYRCYCCLIDQMEIAKVVLFLEIRCFGKKVVDNGEAHDGV